jgi:hypothetical protein
MKKHKESKVIYTPPLKKEDGQYDDPIIEIPPDDEMGDGLNHNERSRHETGFFDLRKYNIKHRKDQLIRNAVNPVLGRYILKCAMTSSTSEEK